VSQLDHLFLGGNGFGLDAVVPVPQGKGQEDDSIKDLGDQATTAYTREFLFELGNGDRRILKEVTAALHKIDEGSFGSCERCGEAISEKRLEALPFARYCITCQRAVEEEERMTAG